VFHFVTPKEWMREKKLRKKPKSVGVVRLANIDQRQHHEDESLQCDDHDVKDGPN
jgi:hypothetical protein